MEDERIVVDESHRLRRQIVRDMGGRERGTAYYRRCALCSLTQWSSSSPDDTKADLVAVVQDDDPNNCPRCIDVHARSPELARWVAGVAEGVVRHMTKKTDETK